LNRLPNIIIYSFSFLVFLYLLEITGLVNLSVPEIYGYGLIFYGVSSVFVLFGKDQKAGVFLGSFAFLAGVYLYIIGSFEFFNTSSLLFPSFFLICGLSSLIVFIDDTSKSTWLIISIVLILGGIIYIISAGSLDFISFIDSIYEIALSYWPVVIITIGIILILWLEEKKS
jgi:hypothetical protein